MKKNHRRNIFVALAALALAITGYWLFAPRDPEVATLTVKRAPADRILAVNGRIRPRLQVDISPSLGGELIALPFDVGDRVAGRTAPRFSFNPKDLVGRKY